MLLVAGLVSMADEPKIVFAEVKLKKKNGIPATESINISSGVFNQALRSWVTLPPCSSQGDGGKRGLMDLPKSPTKSPCIRTGQILRLHPRPSMVSGIKCNPWYGLKDIQLLMRWLL